MPDNLTVLHALGSYAWAAKRFRLSNGHTASVPYSLSKYFDVVSIEIDGLEALTEQLQELNEDHTRFVIRGQLREGVPPTNVRNPTATGPTSKMEIGTISLPKI